MQKMLNLVLSVAASAALFVSSPVDAAQPVRTLKGKITKVVDGDTVHFVPHNARKGAPAIRVRMITIDTPETKLPAPGGVYSQGYWGDTAWKELQSMLEVGDDVEVDDYGVDSNDRMLGRVYKGAMDVNFEMTASGWGVLYIICDGKQDCRTDKAYIRACEDAMKDGRGNFNPRKPLPQLPFIFRSEKQRRPLSKFVGDMRTKTYVGPQHWKKIPLCNRVFFTSEAVAKAGGYKPQRKEPN